MKVIAFYILSVLAAAATFFFVRGAGETLIAPPPPIERASDAAVVGSAPNVLPHLLLAVAAVVAIGRLLGRLFRHFGQPPVIGEVIGGILLGPSLLGLISPAAYQFLLPPSVAPFLGVIAQLGVLIYMFLIGLELNPALMKDRVHTTVAISHASIIFPFVLGSGLALYIYPRFSSNDVSFTSFALFLGLAMSITAFPVLARILSDQGISRTNLGTIALTCASVDDVTAWCLLAFVVGVVNATAGGAVLVAVLTIAFIGLMFFVVRPLINRVVMGLGEGQPSPGVIAAALIGLLLSAWATETIGIHAIFGAF